MTQYEQVCQELESRGLFASSRGVGTTRMAHCPGPLHGRGDKRPSLSVGEGRAGRALLFCHAGCDFVDIIDALGMANEYEPIPNDGDVVAQYVYETVDGQPLLRVSRLQPKGFFQEHWEDGKWVSGAAGIRSLFNLPAVWEAAGKGEEVWLVEGEKDALTLIALGVTATTTVGGIGNWCEEYEDMLRGASVVIVPDLDPAGLSKAEERASNLRKQGVQVRLLYPAAGKDVTDHFNEGYGLEDFLPDEPVDLDELAPLDWNEYNPTPTEWLLRPYVPRQGRVMVFGAAGSLKSLWAMWLASKLSHRGERVAYISLEMTLSDVTKRLRQLKPHPDNFKLFTKFQMDNPDHYRLMRRALQGYSLIVVDSWTAAGGVSGRDQNQAVADADRDLFLPLIEDTGATLLVLDNTGHGMYTKDGDYISPGHARGASAKGDKMDITLLMERPVETNNYRTRISVKKMRIDEPMPGQATIETPQDRIEFYYVEQGVKTQRPFWEEDEVQVEDEPIVTSEELDDDEALALARLKDKLKATEIEEEVA